MILIAIALIALPYRDYLSGLAYHQPLIVEGLVENYMQRIRIVKGILSWESNKLIVRVYRFSLSLWLIALVYRLIPIFHSLSPKC